MSDESHRAEEIVKEISELCELQKPFVSPTPADSPGVFTYHQLAEYGKRFERINKLCEELRRLI